MQDITQSANADVEASISASSRFNVGYEQLVNKSVEAYILALETINRLSITYRAESFVSLLSNAWETLFKAKLIKENVPIVEPNGKFTISITDCLQQIFTNDHDPVRCNIEKVIEIRNDCTHYMLTFVPKEMLALFQTSVLNYHRYLKNWFHVSLSERISIGMMTIVFDFEPSQLDLTDQTLRAKLDPTELGYLLREQKRIREEWERLGRSADYSIDFNYRVAIVKHDGDGIIRLVNDMSGDHVGVIEIAKDPAKTHPYRQKELLQELNRRLDGAYIVNTHDLQCVKNHFGIERSANFYYQGSVQGSPKQFSNEYLEWLLKKYFQDPEFFSKCRASRNGSRQPTVTT